MESQTVTEHASEDRGIDWPDYWQGAGVAFTDWTDCATGIGHNAHEAHEDATEQLASAGWEVDAIPNPYPADAEPADAIREAHENDDVNALLDSPWHYVVIYVR